MPYVQGRCKEALTKFVLFSAIIHVVVLIILALRSASSAPLNYFNLLQIGCLLPGTVRGVAAQGISLVIAAIIYVVILLFFTGKATRE